MKRKNQIAMTVAKIYRPTLKEVEKKIERKKKRKALSNIVNALIVLIISFSMVGCVSTQGNGQSPQMSNATSKGLLGVLTGVAVAAVTGGHSEDYLKYGAIGGAGGYIWGNEQDKSSNHNQQSNNYQYQQPQREYQPRDLRYSHQRAQSGYYDNNYTTSQTGYRHTNNNGQPRTEWRKVIKRVTKDGVTDESITEAGVSTKTENVYYE